MAGSLGPKSVDRAASYADGLVDFGLGLDAGELGGAFERYRRA